MPSTMCPPGEDQTSALLQQLIAVSSPAFKATTRHQGLNSAVPSYGPVNGHGPLGHTGATAAATAPGGWPGIGNRLASANAGALQGLPAATCMSSHQLNFVAAAFSSVPFTSAGAEAGGKLGSPQLLLSLQRLQQAQQAQQGQRLHPALKLDSPLLQSPARDAPPFGIGTAAQCAPEALLTSPPGGAAMRQRQVASAPPGFPLHADAWRAGAQPHHPQHQHPQYAPEPLAEPLLPQPLLPMPQPPPHMRVVNVQQYARLARARGGHSAPYGACDGFGDGDGGIGPGGLQWGSGAATVPASLLGPGPAPGPGSGLGRLPQSGFGTGIHPLLWGAPLLDTLMGEACAGGQGAFRGGSSSSSGMPPLPLPLQVQHSVQPPAGAGGRGVGPATMAIDNPWDMLMAEVYGQARQAGADNGGLAALGPTAAVGAARGDAAGGGALANAPSPAASPPPASPRSTGSAALMSSQDGSGGARAGPGTARIQAAAADYPRARRAWRLTSGDGTKASLQEVAAGREADSLLGAAGEGDDGRWPGPSDPADEWLNEGSGTDSDSEMAAVRRQAAPAAAGRDVRGRGGAGPPGARKLRVKRETKEKCRERNRTAQRRFRERQRDLVEGLQAKVAEQAAAMAALRARLAAVEGGGGGGGGGGAGGGGEGVGGAWSLAEAWDIKQEQEA